MTAAFGARLERLGAAQAKRREQWSAQSDIRRKGATNEARLERASLVALMLHCASKFALALHSSLWSWSWRQDVRCGPTLARAAGPNRALIRQGLNRLLGFAGSLPAPSAANIDIDGRS